jgi:multiple sugar transport system ATP-binding protein
VAEWQHPENSCFALEGAQLCGRVNPNAAARVGAPMRLAVDLNNMHLLNETSGDVLGRP